MQLGGPGAGGDGVVPAAVDFAYVEPDEPAAQDWKVAVRADVPGSATPVRLMGVESTRSIPRAAAPAGPARGGATLPGEPPVILERIGRRRHAGQRDIDIVPRHRQGRSEYA